MGDHYRKLKKPINVSTKGKKKKKKEPETLRMESRVIFYKPQNHR